MCAREEVLAFQEETERDDFSDPDLLLTFLHGTALHWAVQNHILPNRALLYGVWRCLVCGHVVGGLPPEEKAELRKIAASEAPDKARFKELCEAQGRLDKSLVLRPGKCPSCGVSELEMGDELLFEYREQWFGDIDYRIGGHPDGFLVIPGYSGSGILEVKSISSHVAWKVKHTPQMEHLIQAHTYMWLTGRKWALVMYWAKGTHGLKSIIWHFVERDEGTVQKLQKLVGDMRTGIDTGALPSRICNSVHCARAGGCALAPVCFDRENT
jgi:hypothetical protein